MGRRDRARRLTLLSAGAVIIGLGFGSVSRAVEPAAVECKELSARAAWYGRKAAAVEQPAAVQPPAEPGVIADRGGIAKLTSARTAWFARKNGQAAINDPMIRQVQDEPPPPPPPTGVAAEGIPTPPPKFSSVGGLEAEGIPIPNQPDRPATEGPGTTVIDSAPVMNRTDAGSIFAKSPSAIGVSVLKRSPIANETHIRGYNVGQMITYADGAYWFPARQDLDTFLSKIDSGIVRDIIVVKGPYTARMGPGFAFLDIATDPSPRYPCGFDWEGRSVLAYDTNGQQFYGRQMIKAGEDHWGFRLSYGHRTGNDYETGRGFDIPASYNVRDFDFAGGIDLSPDSYLEFGAIRLDQTGLEFPGQVFDTRFLTTDGYRVRYVKEDQPMFDRFLVEGWYNRTVLEGNAQGSGKRRQIPSLEGMRFTGFTNIDLMSTGVRTAMSWGNVRDPLSPVLTVGADYRHIKQELAEHDQLLNLPCFTNFGIPRSHQGDMGGVFVEYSHPFNERFQIRTGARVDYVFYDVDRAPFCECCEDEQDLTNFFGVSNLDSDNVLVLAYVTGEYKLTETLSLLGGFGHAQRPATLTEMYATDPFLAILQQGFTTVRGNPNLKPERLYQVDLGLRLHQERLRAGVSGFHAWVFDYITYETIGEGTPKQLGISLVGFEDALSVRYVNTRLATLVGGEAYVEADVVPCLTPFAVVSYVSGRDHGRGNRGSIVRDSQGNPIPGVGALGAPEEPLPMIAPLESRLGLRFHDPYEQPRWGVELSTRMVAQQDRVASSLLEKESAGFAVVDLRGYVRPRENLLLTAGIENLLDRDYREHLDLRTGRGVYQPGINFYFGVDVRY